MVSFMFHKWSVCTNVILIYCYCKYFEIFNFENINSQN